MVSHGERWRPDSSDLEEAEELEFPMAAQVTLTKRVRERWFRASKILRADAPSMHTRDDPVLSQHKGRGRM